MNAHMVQYTVAEDRVGENEALIQDVVDELARLRPAGLRYDAFKLADGVSFAHVICFDKPGHDALPSLPALQAFHRGLRDRCTAEPVRTALVTAGTYRGD